MSRYEVMLVVDGDLTPDQARDSIGVLLNLFSGLEGYQEKIVEYDKLAYPMKKKLICHRFVLNFDLDDSSVLKEFNRLVNLNKHLLRYLVINESKDRSWRTRNNPKKVKEYEFRQEKFRQWLEKKKQFNKQNSVNYAS